jgi:hypothetical protein
MIAQTEDPKENRRTDQINRLGAEKIDFRPTCGASRRISESKQTGLMNRNFYTG